MSFITKIVNGKLGLASSHSVSGDLENQHQNFRLTIENDHYREEQVTLTLNELIQLSLLTHEVAAHYGLAQPGKE